MSRSDYNTVPSPRQPDIKSDQSQPGQNVSRSSSVCSHSRRDSLPVSPYMTSPARAVPVPVPQRHGSFHRSSTSASDGDSRPAALGSSPIKGLSLSVSSPRSNRAPNPLTKCIAGERNIEWLDATVEEILTHSGDGHEAKAVRGDTSVEEAADILLKEDTPFLLVARSANSYGFFDYADLNSFLLLVLESARRNEPELKRPFPIRADSSGSFTESAIIDDDDEHEIYKKLSRGERITVGDVCNLSQKNPYHSLPSSTPIRSFLPLFASGIHRFAFTSNKTMRTITSAVLLKHLISLPTPQLPTAFSSQITTCGLTLHPLVSLPGTASVLDAMQIMSIEGLSVLGVLSGAGRIRSESSGSTGSVKGGPTTSPLLVPLVSPPLCIESSPLDSLGAVGGLVSVVTVRECASLVVPSEGKQVLGMGLERMVKGMQVVEEGGRDRGEERTPVNTVTPSTTLLHASHLILATSSSRVFLRMTAEVVASTPPLSPVPSLTMSASPPVSPSAISLPLVDVRLPSQRLPRPPPVQYSPHAVISILDILSCLAKSCHGICTPLQKSGLVLGEGQSSTAPWDLDPAGIGKRRRASSFADSCQDGIAFGAWRWVGAGNANGV